MRFGSNSRIGHVADFSVIFFAGKAQLLGRTPNGPTMETLVSAMQLNNPLALPPGVSMRPVMKTKTAFFLRSNPVARLARRFCKDLIRPRRLARVPSRYVSFTAVRTALATRLTVKSVEELGAAMLPLPTARRPNLNVISMGLGQTDTRVPSILRPNEKKYVGFVTD
jgi:hypothetical protein